MKLSNDPKNRRNSSDNLKYSLTAKDLNKNSTQMNSNEN
jgi:hypothetical protein